MISGDSYGVLHRLVLNEKIIPSPEGLLRLLGFVHLYTASGLHLLALESWIQNNPFRTLKAKKLLTVFFWFLVLMLWRLQGYRLGFARILVLFFLRQLAKEKGLKWRVYFPLALTLVFDLILGIDSGWKHYYLAILGGMVGAETARTAQRGWFVQHVYLAVGSWLLTAPLDLIENHVISWMTPFWSLLTIPVISLFLYPASIFFYFTMDQLPQELMNLWNFWIEHLFSLVDFGFTFLVVDSRLIWVCLGLAMFFHFIPRIRIPLPFLVLGIGVYRFLPSFHPHDLELIQMDVGQGDSLLVKNQKRVELIDLGPSDFRHPERPILRLARHGVISVDSVILTHLDEDHVGGIKNCLPWLPISKIETNPYFSRTARISDWIQDLPKTRFCFQGCFVSGFVDWVSTQPNGSKPFKGNKLMGTVMIPVSENEIYLSLGDADSAQEEVFLNRHFYQLSQYSSRILKVSHHGSKNSTSASFLKRVSPSMAVISVGRRNRYHHPHIKTMERIYKLNIPVHRTDHHGDFRLLSRDEESRNRSSVWNAIGLEDMPSSAF
jgi:competence protein ComEC